MAQVQIVQIKADPQVWGLQAGAEEVLEKRHRHAKHFKLPDGRYQAVFGRNLHYEAPGGLLEDVDRSFRAEGADYVADKMPVKVLVSGTWPGLEVMDKAGKGIRWLTPGRPSVTGRRARFSDQGLDWDYVTRADGVKLEAVVAASVGPKTYSFNFQLRGGATALSVDADGNLVSDAFTIPRAFVTGANGQRYECSAWSIGSGNKVAFSFDDTDLSAEAYPYTIDPTTTFNVGASGDDGYVSRVGDSYPPTGGITPDLTSDIVTNKYQTGGSNNYLGVGLVRWDTSSLTSRAVVTSATYRAHVDSISNVDSRNFMIEWYSAANWPIDSADWTSTVASNAHAGTAISSITAAADNDFSLQNLTSINLTGYTGIRCHISGGAPSGSNKVQIVSYDDATRTEPRLVVTYDLLPSGYHMMI